jgi:hypothetical protein
MIILKNRSYYQRMKWPLSMSNAIRRRGIILVMGWPGSITGTYMKAIGSVSGICFMGMESIITRMGESIEGLGGTIKCTERAFIHPQMVGYTPENSMKAIVKVPGLSSFRMVLHTKEILSKENLRDMVFFNGPMGEHIRDNGIEI